MRTHTKALGAAMGLLMFFVLDGGTALAADTCPNAAVRAEQNAQHLPDCRAWELVTPIDKGGQDHNANLVTPYVTEDGSQILYGSFIAPPEVESAHTVNYFRGKRGPRGWTYEPLNPTFTADPFSLSHGPRIELVAPDLSKVVATNYDYHRALVPGAPTEATNLYWRDLESGVHELLTDAGLAMPDPSAEPKMLDATHDLSVVLFESTTSLEAGAPEGQKNLYRWTAATGAELVSVMPSTGEPMAAGVTGSKLGTMPMSDDGSRIYFTAGHDSQVYLWEDGEVRMISESRRTDCADDPGGCSGTPAPDPRGRQPAVFAGATADGSKAFFVSSERLTDNASPDSKPTFFADAGELYEYDADADALTDRTVTTNPENDEGAVVTELVALDDDGQHVYFMARSKLTPDASGVYGTTYLYQVDGASTRLVAEFTGVPSANGPKVSTDGETLTFQSAGVGNVNVNQVYRYTEGEEIVCTSCPSEGEPPNGEAYLFGAIGQRFAETNYRYRNTSPDADRVYFSTPQALVPEDLNEQRDVYQWTPQGVRLISGGRADTRAYFSGTDRSGDSVFFVTRERLVSADRDELTDMYVARANGGYPEVAEVRPDQCEGDACQASPSPPPPNPSSATSSFSGSGDRVPVANCSARKRQVKAARRAVRRADNRGQKAQSKRKLRKAQAKLKSCKQGGNR